MLYKLQETKYTVMITLKILRLLENVMIPLFANV